MSQTLISRLGRMFKRNDEEPLGMAFEPSPTPQAELSDEDFAAIFGLLEVDVASQVMPEPVHPETIGEGKVPAAEALTPEPMAGPEKVIVTTDRPAVDELAEAVRDHHQRSRFSGLENGPLVYAQVQPVENAGTGPAPFIEPRGRLLRPWKRQNETLIQMQRGFSTLTDLMGAIRQSLDAQNRRQEDLVNHLSTLPKVLEMLPEANRMQTEALKVMQNQMDLQSNHQGKLGEILDKMRSVGDAQTASIESMKSRVESLKEHDEAISFNLHAVGSAMSEVSRNSQSSALVLEQMKDNLQDRDQALQQIIQKQGSRFNAMLGLAVVLSASAIAVVGIFGYLIAQGLHLSL